MSRLLSEDAVIHSLMDFTKGKKTLGQCIDDVPTACDIEKVVAELSQLKEIEKLDGMSIDEMHRKYHEMRARVRYLSETQVPKEVEIELVGSIMYKWFCPVCGSGKISGNKGDKPKYCSECGQRLEFLE